MVVVATAAAMTISFGMRRLESRFAPAVQAVAACQPRAIGYNSEAGRVALAVDADKYFVLDGERSRNVSADVVVVAVRYRSNRPGATTQIGSAIDFPGARCYAVGDYRILDVSGHCPPVGPRCDP